MLDLATLTGAMEVALGDLYAGVFANDEAWRDEILAAGEASGDHIWPFPMHPRYRRYVDSVFADLKNSSDLRQAGAVLAAKFLEEFAGDGPWAHADIAGPAFLERSRGDYLSQRGGTGYGVRLIVELATRLSKYEPRPDARARARPLDRPRVRGAAVAPVAAELDREHRFPYELVAELAELGLMGMPIPEEYGGAGTDTLSYAIAVEELTRIDSSVAITMAAHTSLGTMPILLFGTEEQKQQWLPDLASGSKLAAFGLTEPGAGSDAAAARTTAELRDGEWVVNGSKIFITNAGTDITSCVTITARTGEDEISNLIVPNGTPGYEISAPMEKLGWRASDTRELSFRDCAVPEGNLLGERGKGFTQFLEILDGGRISVAAMGVGLAQGAYDLAYAYAKEREQFGKPIARFQAVQFALADMAVELEAGPRAHLQGRVAEGRGPPVRQGGGDGEALHRRALAPRRERRAADPRRLRVHGGIGDRAALPRPEDPRDRRRH